MQALQHSQQTGTGPGRRRARRRCCCGRGAGHHRRRVHPWRAGCAARSARSGAYRSRSGAGRRSGRLTDPQSHRQRRGLADRRREAAYRPAAAVLCGVRFPTGLGRPEVAGRGAASRRGAGRRTRARPRDFFMPVCCASWRSLSPIDRDLLLSDAFLGYADALARGAVPIEARYDDEDLTPEPIDIAAALTRALNSPDPAAVIEDLAPRSPAYLALRGALRSYRADGAEAARAGSAAAPGSGEAQRRAIIVNLERLRWLPRQLPADRIWVNIPTARLELYRDNRPVFTTRVVVGETDKQTPELQTAITSVLFNPPWYVPRSIVTKEILPKLARDPDYLARHHMVMRPNGGHPAIAGSRHGARPAEIRSVEPFRRLSARHAAEVAVQTRRPVREPWLRARREPARTRRPAARRARRGDRQSDRARARPPAACCRSRSRPFWSTRPRSSILDGAIAFAPDVYERDEAIWRRLQRARKYPSHNATPPPNAGAEEPRVQGSTQRRNIA